MNPELDSSKNKDLLVLFLSILALHVFLIGIVFFSKFMLIVAFVESVIAIVLGSKTHSNYGHGGLIIGIVTALASVISYTLVV